MNEQVLFLCEIKEKTRTGYTLKGELQDETVFEVEVPKHLVTPIENTNPQRAWLQVEYSGEANMVASITLPKPVLDFGHKISVSTSRIKRVPQHEQNG
jgi:hypothetical protein